MWFSQISHVFLFKHSYFTVSARALVTYTNLQLFSYFRIADHKINEENSPRDDISRASFEK